MRSHLPFLDIISFLAPTARNSPRVCSSLRADRLGGQHHFVSVGQGRAGAHFKKQPAPLGGGGKNPDHRTFAAHGGIEVAARGRGVGAELLSALSAPPSRPAPALATEDDGGGSGDGLGDRVADVVAGDLCCARLAFRAVFEPALAPRSPPPQQPPSQPSQLSSRQQQQQRRRRARASQQQGSNIRGSPGSEPSATLAPTATEGGVSGAMATVAVTARLSVVAEEYCELAWVSNDT